MAVESTFEPGTTMFTLLKGGLFTDRWRERRGRKLTIRNDCELHQHRLFFLSTTFLKRTIHHMTDEITQSIMLSHP